ncbi:MAG: YggU family protein [Chloroflexi bacterium RBG_13_56_8b]|nr:MAG: YggU family protein [Chloroflexi bacterium RBG_13_56_8b]
MSFSERGVELWLRVHPNAARNELVGFSEGVLRLKIAAPPVRGKANKELIAFLAQKLGLSKGDLTILKGHSSRNKLISIAGLSREELTRRLSPG